MPAVDRTGVNADFVCTHERLREHRMAKDNRLFEIKVCRQECIAGPEAPLRRLLAEVSTWLQTGMDVKGILVLPIEREGPEKGEMIGWNLADPLFQ